MTDSIDRFAEAHASRLLEKFSKEVEAASHDPDQKRIHDLRVSIRRLSQCLIVFQQFFRRRKTKKTLKKLDGLMDLAADIRNRDIAIELIGAANADLAVRLGKERAHAKRKLVRALGHRRWREIS